MFGNARFLRVLTETRKRDNISAILVLCCLRLQVYLWFLEFLKVEWEAVSSDIIHLSCETSS